MNLFCLKKINGLLSWIKGASVSLTARHEGPRPVPPFPRMRGAMQMRQFPKRRDSIHRRQTQHFGRMSVVIILVEFIDVEIDSFTLSQTISP